MRPVKVAYGLTVEQFMAACNALWSHRAIGKNGNWIISVALGFATAFSVMFSPFAALFFATAALFFAVATPLRNQIWRRHYGTLVKYTGPITATFSPDAIDFQSAEGAFSQPWQVFNAYTETADYIFLHVGLSKARGQFSIIPKSALPSSDDLTALMALLSAHLTKRAKRWF
jgi:YcxB-like protein